MLTYIARRILYSIPVLFLSSFLSFVFVSYAGNPLGNLRANPRIPANTLRLVAERNHLNDPVVLRYFYWLKDFVTDKMGKSLLTFQPIWPDVHRTILHTAQVVIIAETLAIILGIAVGIFSAIRQYSVFDYTFTSLSFLGYAMPTFWLGLLLQILFVDIYLKWHVRIFYTSGLNSLPGAVLGGVILGVAESLTGAYLTIQFKNTLAFVVIIVVLLIRPEGLLGREFKERV